ncbi:MULTISPECIES: hypothetical protein [Streptomyces]|uniref:hypothetical protein n=1 Tax=Streptomyces TaxID=1883 RepID=UPI00163C05E4|nr:MULTISPECIES: hypothetical protein [Streptomyces]MBC2878797.1 hypothetical protein [Streptomyces sp. TYQ1024]UBI39284.1 hypothetical protein K7I03_24370 [Streptomyces mobaraensis]UKW31865.1 hypothetical protein MCU78_24310 [Streptomyces sp. TYQ1024]
MIGSRGAGITLASLALLAAAAGGVPAAQAGGQAREYTALECTGQENITYGPGLGLSSAGSAKVSVDGTYHCTDGSGHRSTATYHTEGMTGGGCLLLSWNRSKETLRFADGTTTVIAYQAGPSVRVAGLNTALLRGEVVGGRGKGAAAEKTIQTLPGSLPTDCAIGGGIRHTTGLTHLSIHP